MSLRYGILGLLSREPLHGYEIKQRFEELLGGTWEVNIGQVYTTFQRLERDQLIQPLGSRGDRGKLSYAITEAGRQAFERWLDQPAEHPQQLREDIYVKLLLAARLANGRLWHILNGQRRVCLQQLHDLGELEARARREGRTDLALMLAGAILHTEADLKWIDACAEQLESETNRRRS
jgi:DNA-binding PadR family transcriptional regulator